MHLRLSSLFLFLSFLSSPAAYAMKGLRPLLTSHRSLGQLNLLKTTITKPSLTSYKQELLPPKHKDDERKKFEDTDTPRKSYNSHLIAATILGLGFTTEQILEEQECSESIRKLDVTDAQAVINVLLYGTEDDKRAAAHLAAKNITSYWDSDIIMLLQVAKGRSHRILVNALANNITHFWSDQINKILLADQQDETHDLISRALIENYNYFTSYSIAGFKIVTAKEGIYVYTDAISNLQEKYKTIAMEALAADLASKSLDEITAIVGKREGIMDLFSKKRQIMMTTIAENIHKYDKSAFARIMNAASGDDFKDSIVPGIAKNIDKYDQASLAPILQPHLLLLLFYSTIENGECITTALSKTIEKDLPLYTEKNLVSILRCSNEQTAEQITALIARDIHEKIGNFNGSTLTHFASKAKGQVQDTIISQIVENIDLKIDSLSTIDAATLLTITNGQNKATIKEAILKKIDKFLIAGTSAAKNIFAEGICERPADIIKLLDELDPYHQKPIVSLLLSSFDETSKSLFINALLASIDPSIHDHTLDSQSAAHLRSNTLKAYYYLQKVMQENSKFRVNPKKHTSIFQNALRQERLLSDKHAVFYHSHKNTNYWLEILYTKLWERKHNQAAGNYLFTRFPDDRNELANAIQQEYGAEKRAELLAKGRLNDKDPLRSYLFFTNYAFYGNLSNLGSCTPHYYLTDYNVRDPEIKTQDIINKFGNDEIFKLYEPEFELLEREFNQVVQDSVLLQLGIPMDALKDHVFLAAPGGYKKKLKINDQETDNVPTIINTLKKEPLALDDSDEQEFCVVMTPDTVHTLRDQGAQVNVFGDFDQEKLNIIIAKLEALIARIAKEHPTTFSSRMTPSKSYQTYKPVLDELLKRKD